MRPREQVPGWAIADEDRREREWHDPERFDRVAFAMRALAILAPKRLTVAVYERAAELRVECARDPSKGPGARWAIVGVPAHASRAHIAYALAELVGVADVPLVVAGLLRRATVAERDAADPC